MTIEISLSQSVDFARLGALWQDLEARADGSFFQSWAWVGCQAPLRFSDPLLLQVQEAGAVIALGLFNRRRRLGRPRLLLNESGRAQYDAVFVEHNGILIERCRGDDLLANCLAQVLRHGGRGARRGAGSLVLSGVPERYVAAVAGGPRRVETRAATPAPFVDLARIRAAGRPYLEYLSGNTRYQLGRSRRRYEAAGPLTIRGAATVDEAQEFLSRLAWLHQKHWTSRGKPGAFANPAFEQFHRALIARGFSSGAIDLLRVRCGEHAVGYLYNFRYRGTVFAYQSGFDYSLAERHQHPGLTCHHLAIERYLSDGAARYDFLAGDARYKSSLATGAVDLYWLEMGAWRDWHWPFGAKPSAGAVPVHSAGSARPGFLPGRRGTL